MNEVDPDTSQYLHHVSTTFSPLSYAFAYGSGMFKQAGHKSTKDNMLDFIFVVDDATEWHRNNIRAHPHHYSALKYLSASRVAHIQNSYGAAIYFNTLVCFEGRLMKYGVMDMEHFLRDMRNWETLYVSGRLHKPVVVISGAEDYLLNDVVRLNLRSALETSLVLLPERFTELELFTCITGLSYSGDVRMIVGEDKGKVHNIVAPNVHKFRDLYAEVIRENQSLSLSNGTFTQDVDQGVLRAYIDRMPSTLHRHVLKQHNSTKNLVLDRESCRRSTVEGLHSIVRKSSTSQTIKGVATAGLNKSLVYGLQKLNKMMKSLKR